MSGILLVVLAGCSKTVPPLLTLQMFDETQSALYIVNQDGTIKFGGGLWALSGKTNWTGELTTQQISTLRTLLKEERLQNLDNRLIHCFVIKMQVGESTKEFVMPLTNTSAIELYYFLEESTLSRISSHLSALPKPSMDIISNRAIKGSKQ